MVTNRVSSTNIVEVVYDGFGSLEITYIDKEVDQAMKE